VRGGLTPQLWILLAAIVLGVLVNLLIRWISERGRETAKGGEPAPRPVPAPVPGPALARVPAARHATTSPAPRSGRGLETGRPVARGRRRPIDLGRRNVRQAIVLMAVLGPCRAVAPQGPDAIPAPPG
jgi:hypothetical protein